MKGKTKSKSIATKKKKTYNYPKDNSLNKDKDLEDSLYDKKQRIKSKSRKGEKNSRKSSKGYKRPPLNLFLRQLRSQLDDKNTLVEFEFPDYNEAWNEWMHWLPHMCKMSLTLQWQTG